mmetsp:Transcript_26247/g.23230  ORF Transcript_26247/g.23230 Transcript_26247/m.23230 type:complete len:147 (+) Transcript_26247:539-979(+)
MNEFFLLVIMVFLFIMSSASKWTDFTKDFFLGILTTNSLMIILINVVFLIPVIIIKCCVKKKKKEDSSEDSSYKLRINEKIDKILKRPISQQIKIHPQEEFKHIETERPMFSLNMNDKKRSKTPMIYTKRSIKTKTSEDALNKLFQ